MDLEWFYDELSDELCSSLEYIKMAIQLKAMSQTWSDKFKDISSDELKHAGCLYTMLQEYINRISEAYKELPSHISKCLAMCTENYTEMYSKITTLHNLYSNK